MSFINISIDQIEIFLLVFTRITAILLLMPIFGSDAIPMQLKAGLCLIVAVILFPIVKIASPVEPVGLIGFAFLVVKEVFIGLTIGYATTFLFAAVQFAGRILDSEIGFAMVELIDPFSNTMVSATAQLQILLFSVLFLLINGHCFMLLALQKSFEVIPIFGAKLALGGLVTHFIRMGGDIFVLAIKLAAPVFLVLSLTSMALGIIARTVPQINIFFVGLPIKIFLGLGLMAVVLPVLADMFKVIVNGLMEDIWKLLYLMA
jgi:flagellar biosynthetic protein FliR